MCKILQPGPFPKRVAIYRGTLQRGFGRKKPKGERKCAIRGSRLEDNIHVEVRHPRCVINHNVRSECEAV